MRAISKLGFLWRFGLFFLLLQTPALALESQPFIKDSFPNLKEDLADATKAGRILMVVFEQDGCPYCAQMHQIHFVDKTIVARLSKSFDVIQLDIWGGREVAGFNGEHLTEKQLARELRVQFSPTIAFYDAKGKEIYRMAGLHKPAVFKAELEFLSSRAYERMNFRDYASRQPPMAVSKSMLDEPFFVKTDDLKALSEKAWAEDKVLVLLFAQAQCDDCREMHDLYFKRKDTVALLTKYFEVMRVDLAGNRRLTGLNGAKLSEVALAKSLGINQAPTMVFFDRSGEEILRYEEHLSPEDFTEGLLTFIGTHAYRQHASLQDWLRIKNAARAAQQ